LPIEFEHIADEVMEQGFNANQQAKDELSDCEKDSDSSSCAGSKYMLKLSLNIKLFYSLFNQINIALMIINVYNTIIESAKVEYHWETGQKPIFLPTTCPK